MYDALKTLFENRTTPRYVDQNDIPVADINKILDAAKLAPSFDKIYPYEIFVLTNSQAGINKKEELIERYVCRNTDGTHANPGDPWNNREIVQPILSGLALVYVAIPKASTTSNAGPDELVLIAHRDAIISATYAMLAAESLGYRAGMFSGITLPAESARLLFTDSEQAKVVTTVTVANRDIRIVSPNFLRNYIDYKRQRPFVLHSKHRDKSVLPNLTIL